MPVESLEEFGNRWRDRALEAELEIKRLREALADAEAAKGMEVTLYFPHTERLCVLPALPRTGEQLVWVLDNDDADEGTWNVTEVQWHLSETTGTTVGVSLEPADEHTKQLMDQQEAERLAAVRAAARKDLREAIRANRPEAPDIYQPVREAMARQDAALIANQEPQTTDRTNEQ